MDESFLRWLMLAIGYCVQIHARLQKQPTDNAGPRYYDKEKTYEAFEENFARWMGWRGQDAQEEEIRRKRQEKGV